jgi:ZIP family zinc transporter
MVESILWGLVAASSLLIGAIIAIRVPPHPKTLGLVMAFGSGVLLSAVSFELVAEASAIGGGTGGVVFGFLAGAAVFTVGDIAIGRFQRRRQGVHPVPSQSGAGLAILLGALLDGIPETAVLGLIVLETGDIGVAMLAAVFLSNLPEGVAATSNLIEAGWKRSTVLAIWVAVVVVTALAAGLGYAVLDGASSGTLAFVYSFSGGAVLTMLVTSMVPEAYERAGRAVGFITVIGFFLAYALHLMEG